MTNPLTFDTSLAHIWIVLTIIMSGCFSVLWQGRRLGSEAVSRTQVSQILRLKFVETLPKWSLTRLPRAWTTASSPATAQSPAQPSASGEFFVFCCQWCGSSGTRTFKALKTRSSHFPLIQAEKIRTVESYLSSIKAHSCQWPWLKSIFELLNILIFEFRQIWNWIWSNLW